MRSLRSGVALMSIAFVMACQTIGGTGALAGSVSPAYSSVAGAPEAQPTASATAPNYAREKKFAAAEMSGSKKKTIVVLAIVAAVVVAAILIAGGSDSSGY